MNILITGANGFIGKQLGHQMKYWGHNVLNAVRGSSDNSNVRNMFFISDIGPDTDWSKALKNIEVVIHLAACVHQRGSSAAKNIQKFNQINTEGTRNLVVQAVKQKVDRFIFLSTVKVYGETIADEDVLTETSKVGENCDAYGLSKLKAEQLLQSIASNSNMDYVIIRSPLVYGTGVGANFKSLMDLLKKPIPLPFAAINNQRSMVAIDNLLDFIHCCLSNEQANNHVFLISDNDDISLPRLIKTIREAMDVPERQFSFPLPLLKLLTQLIGKSSQLNKLTGSIQLDISKATKRLSWEPVITTEEALHKTINGVRFN